MNRLFRLSAVLMLCCVLCISLAFPGYAAGGETPRNSWRHILLVGLDRRPGEKNARSDSMILCSFCPGKKEIVMTSLMRDLYVAIPGYGWNRLNAAYAFGGTALLKKTLHKNLGLQPEGVFEVDFSQFPQVIDALGGVTVQLRADEAQAVNTATGGSLTEGLHTLNGLQALAYVRIRDLDSDGDFSRTGRQRKLLHSLLQAQRQASLPTLLSVMNQALPMLSTDMETGQVVQLALDLFPILHRSSITSRCIPAEGTYRYRTIDKMCVLAADLPELRKNLRDFFPE